MADTSTTIIRADGARGQIVDQHDGPAGHLTLLFDDGARVVVDKAALVAQPDGSCRIAETPLPAHEGPAGVTAGDALVVPAIAEEIEVETHQVARGTVRVSTRVETRDQVVETPHVHEEVVVEHVPVNTVVEGDVPQVTEEGGVLVIPVLEEVAVVEKRLMLREFVRVSKRRTTTNIQETVVLRHQVVDVERIEDAAKTASPANHPPMSRDSDER